MRKLLLILVLSSTVLWGRAFAEAPAFDVIRPRALDLLRHELHGADQWVKVHAAEALLEMSYAEGVDPAFRQELALHGDQPEYRVGIRRLSGQSING